MTSASRAAAALSVVLLLVSCSASDGSGDEAADGTRSVEHALGTSTIPTDPERVVAVDELAALSAMSVGVEPAVVFTSTGDAPARRIIETTDAEIREVALGQLPDPEDLAELDPDLIVGTGADAPVGQQHETLENLAPTVVLGIEGDWRDLVQASAAAFGEAEAGKRQVAAVEQLLDAAEDTSDGRSLSLLGYSTEPFSMPPDAPSSRLIADAGFTRPAWQQRKTDSYSLPMPPEDLGEQDADLVVVPEGQFYPSDTLLKNPLARTLTGEVVRPVAEQWFGTTPFAFHVVATDLATLADGDTDLVTADEIPDAWDAFIDATDG